MRSAVLWDRSWLERMGFEGFLALESTRRSAPAAAGVYVVVRESSTRPKFLAASHGGWFKGRDPSAPDISLWAKWIEDAQVVYIGQGVNLRRRLSQLWRFGQGAPVGHWGGRYLWQLADNRELIVAWKRDSDPIGAETALLDRFVAVHGSRPFANLR